MAWYDNAGAYLQEAGDLVDVWQGGGKDEARKARATETATAPSRQNAQRGQPTYNAGAPAGRPTEGGDQDPLSALTNNPLVLALVVGAVGVGLYAAVEG